MLGLAGCFATQNRRILWLAICVARGRAKGVPVPSLIDKKPLLREGLITNRKIADIVKDKKFLVLPDLQTV